MVHFVEWKVAVIRSNSLMKNLTVIPMKTKGGKSNFEKKNKTPTNMYKCVCLQACIYESNQHPHLPYYFSFSEIYLMPSNLPPTTRIEFSSFKIIMETGIPMVFFRLCCWNSVWFCLMHKAQHRREMCCCIHWQRPWLNHGDEDVWLQPNGSFLFHLISSSAHTYIIRYINSFSYC